MSQQVGMRVTGLTADDAKSKFSFQVVGYMCASTVCGLLKEVWGQQFFVLRALGLRVEVILRA